MIKNLWHMAFYSHAFILAILGAISITALAAALLSQYGFGLHPCILCLYQRIPYAVVILSSLMGLFALSSMPARFAIFNIIVCAVAFFINSGIAAYHVGVEQHWWVSGCSVPNFNGLSAEEIMASLTVTSTPRCDEIPWQLFGISMAGYNALLCAGLGAYATLTSIVLYKKQ